MKVMSNIKQYCNGAISERVGTGPYFVSYGRDVNGVLKWVEIVTEEEAILRADRPPREEDLRIAINLVQALQADCTSSSDHPETQRRGE